MVDMPSGQATRAALHDVELTGLVKDLAAIVGLTVVSGNPTQPDATSLEMASEREDARVDVAYKWIAARNGVSEAFEGVLALSPGWDILLELYVKQFQPRPLSLKSLCLACHAPQTTALRWIRILEERGLIRRYADEKDGRRWFVELTNEGLAKMHHALDASLTSRFR